MFVPIGSNSGEGYQTQRSWRLRASASANASRLNSGSLSQQKITFSFWLKRGTLDTNQCIFSGGAIGGSYGDYFRFNTSNQLEVIYDDTANAAGPYATTELFRDPTAPAHIQVTFDTTQAVQADRCKIWRNNQSLTISNGLALNALLYFGYANSSIIGRRTLASDNHFDGYLSEFFVVYGQALTPSAFGEFDPTVTTYWKPKSPAQVRAAVAVGGGARNGFGTNGLYLPFSDPTSLTTLMYDRSQSDTDTTGNNWTASNVSLTAGATYDSMLDVPLGGGGQERGNYCTLNPLVPSAANITNANLSSGTTPVRGTFDCSLFNSQWEVTAGASAVTAGVITEAGTANTTTVTANKTFAFRLSTAGALDYKNITDAGSWTSITTGLSGTRFPYGTGAAASWNFGQRPLAEAVTAGYYTLHTGNLTNTTVVTSGSFTGNLSTDGLPVWCNGTPETLTINGNAVTWGTHADKLATGFKLRTSSSSYNSSGTNTWTATYLSPSSKSAFKYQNAKGNP